jgi:hypothetical protein
MKDRHTYTHTEGRYDGAKFIYRTGLGLSRITNDPDDEPRNLAPITDINKGDWIDQGYYSMGQLAMDVMAKS